MEYETQTSQQTNRQNKDCVSYISISITVSILFNYFIIQESFVSWQFVITKQRNFQEVIIPCPRHISLYDPLWSTNKNWLNNVEWSKDEDVS